jgi:hypothetical protein
MNAYLLSHNGLGDNITMIGAINCLLKYYENIYFLCKDTNKENIAAFFPDKPVIVIPFAESDEFTQPAQIIEQATTNPTNDIFVCGFAHKHIARYRRINNPKFLEYKPNEKNYQIKPKWQHIQDFYHNIHMDLSIYYEYFDIPSTDTEFKKTHTKIIFIHTKSSKGEITINLDIDQLLNTIMICANKNMYPETHPNYKLADKYVDAPITSYTDVIKNANEIHIVDSCFSCIVYPLEQTNRLKATKIVIYDR